MVGTVELSEWPLAFASTAAGHSGPGELSRWEAQSSDSLPGCLREDGATPPREEAGWVSAAAVPMGVRRSEVPGGPGAPVLGPGPLSRCLLPASFRGTVNPLNGLGGNCSSPLLNGSSDAACGALEVAELRPYSGPNHPPTPSQNNNNPSAILAAGGTEAAFVLGPSGDPLLVQQQCPFVRPARWTGTVSGRFCSCLFSLEKLKGAEGAEGSRLGGSCSHPPLGDTLSLLRRCHPLGWEPAQ